ncbi:tetratricopeptide repeat protein [Pseudodesulfovibrio piezophilus]|uniref:Tetratricopeptide TPR_4 protein n=1 Tax=Pseudodesulfovibrio piezophilus (strain DSM 21447 / JCM 15486 / C1TLV30) TaxID=1322246 RepID=M1WP14_PSEP2|nr:tetratricopeptide repeat protein [Pseudodesulfovibrio piezophilus]CCH47944.1 Tetratricopeptide TPR_4 protein [Pseudodesulfovibrio piezophilus C1TLV30]
MIWKFFSRNKSTGTDVNSKIAQSIGGGETLPVQDTRAAIEELSQVVKNDPEAVEIYLALGSLYRSQGEIERAIQIRNSLILRPGLDRQFKARALFELGRDFRRGGFLDRAEKAFEESRSCGQDQTAIQVEMARLAIERGDFAKAAEFYGQLGEPLAQANSLVRLAMDSFGEGKDSQAHRSLRHAIRAYPGAVEAWLEQITHAYKNGNSRRMADILREALEKVAPELRFVLLEGLLQVMIRAEREVAKSSQEESQWLKTCSDKEVCDVVIPVLEHQEPDVLLLYYGAAFMLRIKQYEDAKNWLEKALVLQSDFWVARLELFELSKNDQTLTPFFKDQLAYFMGHARNVRRFYCRQCGLKRDQIFFNCPRCRSWHSIAFRTDFSQ